MTADTYPDVRYFGGSGAHDDAGWYWYDEDGEEHGPFDSEEDATAEAEAYRDTTTQENRS